MSLAQNLVTCEEQLQIKKIYSKPKHDPFPSLFIKHH
jgi:hypothetical protein